MTGAVLSAPLILSLESCNSEGRAITQKALSFFKEDQMRLLTSIVDTILPKTDSPSASEVGVPQMIDTMVSNVYDAESQSKYKSGLSKLTGYLTKESKGKGYHMLDNAEQKLILENLTKSDVSAFADAKQSLLDIKQQTIAYYLNTEEVATKFMNYLPVPGQYEGCISLESVGGKAWAL